MRMQGVRWVPGTSLIDRIKSVPQWEGADRFHVQIWRGNTTDIANIAKEVEQAEQALGTPIWIVDEFKLSEIT